MAIKRPFSCASPDFQLDPVCGVDEAGAAAMHFLTGHRAQTDQKPKLIFGVELLQSHVLRFVFFFHKEAAGLSPSILAFDAVVVQHIRRAVYCHKDFIEVRKAVFFKISRPRRVRLHKQE